MRALVIGCWFLVACGAATTPSAPAPPSAPSASEATPAPSSPPAPAPTSAPSSPPPAIATAPAPVMPPAAGTKFALVVSFGSECCGTDRAASDALDHITERYAADALGAKRGRWGKEGEFDACFTLAGLTTAERARVVQEVKTQVAGKLVKVRENTTCQNDRP